MILVSDYDRTLKINDEVSPYDREMIEAFELAGHTFCVNSGRSYHHLMENFEIHGFKSKYTITGSGSQSHDWQGNSLFKYHMPQSTVLKISAMILGSSALSYQISTPQKWVFSRRNDVKWSKLIEFINTETVNSMSAKFENADNARLFCKEVNALENCSAYQNGVNVDIAPYRVSKATGIRNLIDNLGIKENEVYTIGDSLNDLEMIREFKGFCVEVSHPKILEVSQGVFTSVGACINYLMKTHEE